MKKDSNKSIIQTRKSKRKSNKDMSIEYETPKNIIKNSGMFKKVNE